MFHQMFGAMFRIWCNAVHSWLISRTSRLCVHIFLNQHIILMCRRRREAEEELVRTDAVNPYGKGGENNLTFQGDEPITTTF